MLRKIEGVRITGHDAMEMFPTEYILVRMNGRDTQPAIGDVLYVGKNKNELWKKFDELEDQNYCGVISGIDLVSMGGIISYAAD